MLRTSTQRLPTDQLMGFMRYVDAVPGYVNGRGGFDRPAVGQVWWQGPVDPRDSNPEDFVVGTDYWLDAEVEQPELPPQPGLFFTDFSEYETGVAPSDWSERWSGAPDNDVEVREVGGAMGGKVLKYTRNASGNRYIITWDALDADDNADCEVLAKWRREGITASWRIVLRASGSNEPGYVLGVRNTIAEFPSQQQAARYAGGSIDTLQVNEPALTSDDWIWTRARADGNRLRSKSWVSTGSEPEDWAIDVVDDTPITGNGWIGLFLAIVGSANVGCEVDWFGCNVQGLTIVKPE